LHKSSVKFQNPGERNPPPPPNAHMHSKIGGEVV